VIIPSLRDPHVWSGPASQENFVDLSALRSCINVSGLCLERFVLRAIMDVLGGQVQVFFPTLAGAVEHIRAGKLRPLDLHRQESAAFPRRSWLELCL
jgi:hypothetical protein